MICSVRQLCGLVVRAFACEAGTLVLILNWIIPMTFKTVSAASLALKEH